MNDKNSIQHFQLKDNNSQLNEQKEAENRRTRMNDTRMQGIIVVIIIIAAVSSASRRCNQRSNGEIRKQVSC